MKESILKVISALMPMSVWCWAIEEPRAAAILFFIGMVAALELTYIKTKK
jgi:hypothetical protein